MAATDNTEGEVRVQSTNPFVWNVRCLCWPERSYTRDAPYLRLEDILWLRKQLTEVALLDLHVRTELDLDAFTVSSYSSFTFDSRLV